MSQASALERPRLGFAGLGWIGGQRMRVLAATGLADVAAVCEPNPRRVDIACESLDYRPIVCADFDRLLELPLDGIVIATPNVLHEPQAAAAMRRALPVFSQKPLAVSNAGTRRLLELARQNNLPLGVDWSYRYLTGVADLKQRILEGELGAVTAAELAFHNAYGPDAEWYYELARAGGGCLLDLGSHLLDLCHWLLAARDPAEVRARCFRSGRLLHPPVIEPEDFVMADIDYASGQHVHLSCSWRASAGCGAIISCRFFGTHGGAEIRNVGGSFYDFEVAVHHGAETEVLGAPPDPWPGRALIEWTQRLRSGAAWEDELEQLCTTAILIDAIYGRNGETQAS